MQLTFLNFIVINTSAFDNINLLSNSNDIYLSKLKPRANRRNIVGSCCVRLHVAQEEIIELICFKAYLKIHKRSI